MVERLTRDRWATGRASPASLRCGPSARHIYPSLVLVQPRKTRPCLTERLLMGPKKSNKTKYIHGNQFRCSVFTLVQYTIYSGHTICPKSHEDTPSPFHQIYNTLLETFYQCLFNYETTSWLFKVLRRGCVMLVIVDSMLILGLARNIL